MKGVINNESSSSTQYLLKVQYGPSTVLGCWLPIGLWLIPVSHSSLHSQPVCRHPSMNEELHIKMSRLQMQPTSSQTHYTLVVQVLRGKRLVVFAELANQAASVQRHCTLRGKKQREICHKDFTFFFFTKLRQPCQLLYCFILILGFKYFVDTVLFRHLISKLLDNFFS